MLVGLNNSGKTSVLQAVYLLVSALQPLAKARNNLFSTNPAARRFSHDSAFASLGFPDPTWINYFGAEVGTSIAGEFVNGLIVELPESVRTPMLMLNTKLDTESLTLVRGCGCLA